jgi:hypothetical protein
MILSFHLHIMNQIFETSHLLFNPKGMSENSKKVKLFLYKPWRPLGLREVEVPTFLDIRLTDGGKVVSPTCQPLFTPRKFPGTHFC